MPESKIKLDTEHREYDLKYDDAGGPFFVRSTKDHRRIGPGHADWEGHNGCTRAGYLFPGYPGYLAAHWVVWMGDVPIMADTVVFVKAEKK